ncbi:sucrose-6-phosphate hydrolase [Lactobacillus sp. ESL0731]|uniref:sucrose-6-phosphate hydrolase n=1 Tax=unclassified Lactobacillus TaxID=2620435 RepID=UPI0023F7E96B|nr:MULTISPECIES: sucrose-6-phosphate hydrolase [unclassified Lactobacillus]WEV50786.1 sucrose-6-phosphate hydrolase [Lactobacillus sp. ESL0700]WEV61917.1 sucrose-6-phosphate hydrolase [Lactobacillus sp. ESL0731]
MEWSRKQRYASYQSYDEKYISKIRQQTRQSKYLPHYHIHPSSGLLNDPNGFSYFNQKWHLFYQSFPFGAVHGVKSWNHLTSTDLVSWEDLGLSILPDTDYDRQGVFSGSAIALDDELFIMYTGNTRDQEWQRTSYQMGAWLNKDNKLTKIAHPLITQPDFTTSNIRDPQIIKYQNEFYCFLGAQDRKTSMGRILVYHSKNLDNWTSLGYVKFPSEIPCEMIECPNLLFIDGHPVFIFCPQKLDKTVLDYDNIYPNIYWLGESFDFKSLKFTSKQLPQNLDEGFDLYASQGINYQNQAYAVSWIGLPDISYPTDSENWANCLSLVKELHVQDNKLVQMPVHAIKKYRQQPQKLFTNTEIISTGQFELALKIPAQTQNCLNLGTNDEKVMLYFDTQKGELVLDRSMAGGSFAQEYGTKRSLKVLPNHELTLDIFVDHSVIEIFVNNGLATMTGRFFLNEKNIKVWFTNNTDLEYTGIYWNIKMR